VSGLGTARAHAGGEHPEYLEGDLGLLEDQVAQRRLARAPSRQLPE